MGTRRKAIPVDSELVSAFPEVQNGLFKVTPQGVVYRRSGEEFVLAPQNATSRDGKYKTVTATVNGKQKSFYVHRLVAEAYIPNPDVLPQVNHKNGNGHDNRKGNLEWCTRSENQQHSCDLGLRRSAKNSGSPCRICKKPTIRGEICGKCAARERLEEAKEERKNAKGLAFAERVRGIDFGVLCSLDDRTLEILQMRTDGKTLEEIGKVCDRSRQRIEQILLRTFAKSARAESARAESEARNG